MAQRQVLSTRYSLLSTIADKEALAVETAIFAALQVCIIPAEVWVSVVGV